MRVLISSRLPVYARLITSRDLLAHPRHGTLKRRTSADSYAATLHPKTRKSSQETPPERGFLSAGGRTRTSARPEAERCRRFPAAGGMPEAGLEPQGGRR